MRKWTDTAPSYLMVDVVMKNKSGQAYDQELDIWVVVYGSKGYYNDLPIQDVWDVLYSIIHDGFIYFNSPLLIDNPWVSLSPTTKQYVDNATRKIWYKGGSAHNFRNQVRFHPNGSNLYNAFVSQSDNADFTVRHSDHSKIIINNAGLYLITYIDGVKSKSDSYLRYTLHKNIFMVNKNQYNNA